MVLSGPFEDQRPWWCVTVTGHPDAIPGGYWQVRPFDPWDALSQPGAAVVRNYLDAVLCRRKGTHRLGVLCRGEGAGIDDVVRAYCRARKIWCHPQSEAPGEWGASAGLRLTLSLLARSSAVVWFGPREGECDIVSLARLFGIPAREVPLSDKE